MLDMNNKQSNPNAKSVLGVQEWFWMVKNNIWRTKNLMIGKMEFPSLLTTNQEMLAYLKRWITHWPTHNFKSRDASASKKFKTFPTLHRSQSNRTGSPLIDISNYTRRQLVSTVWTVKLIWDHETSEHIRIHTKL